MRKGEECEGMDSKDKLVKADFDFGWKKWKQVPEIVKLVLERQKGDVLDIGCATCQLYSFLRDSGWNGKYYGIDIVKHTGYEYPKAVDLLIGDALTMDFPEADTVVLHDVLEHVDDPVKLLTKAMKAARGNVLVSVPLRNEEMWSYGVVEPHQIDRTHKHSGFSKDEFKNIVTLSGGKIADCIDISKADATIGVNLWESRLAKKLTYLMRKMFKSKEYYCGMWCELVRA